MSPERYAVNAILQQIERDTVRDEMRAYEHIQRRELDPTLSWHYSPRPTVPRRPGMYKSYKHLRVCMGIVFVSMLGIGLVVYQLLNWIVDAAVNIFGR